jgi:hypothetical protein
MTIEKLTETVNGAVAQFNFTAKATGQIVTVYTAKREVSGTVDIEGNVERRYVGRRTMMGWMVSAAISKAVKEAM